ncbi:MAG: ABC transporter permease [Alphaproteobacteria bacterium]
MNPFKGITQHSFLLWQLTRKDIVTRTRGSFLGVLWLVISPLIMLTVYSIIFGTIFPSKWSANTDTPHSFILFLFMGLMIHTFISDTLSRAPHLITQHTNLVKKHIFPLEILPWVSVFSTLIHLKINFIILFAAMLFLGQSFTGTILFLPLIFLPFLILVIGLIKIMATLGVFVRDIGQITGMISSILLFASPVFYPITRLPEALQPFIYLNPITHIIIETRNVTLHGTAPDFKALGIYMIIALSVYALSNWIFKKARPHFADVL